MREILFRGKTSKGEWVEGFYTKGFKYPDEEKLHDLIYTFLADEENNEWRFYCEEVIPETVGQFVGITDKKNGKKIFEGDIVKGSKVRDMMIVVFSQSGCFIVVSCGGWWDFIDNIGEIEVIGNIIDNKELLDKGE